MLYPSLPATAMAVLLLAVPHAPALAQDEDVSEHVAHDGDWPDANVHLGLELPFLR